jgi:pimeloyl-ACP methyl ester carboxylesterase
MAFTQNDGVKIYWREAGQGEPLLMIMGLGYTAAMWHHIEQALSQHYRLIMFDNRGVGQSDAPLGPYHMSEMADDAAAVLDAAGVSSAHVLGFSMGGYIAQEFTLNNPERVHSLILSGTSFGGDQAILASQEVLELLQARITMSAEEGIQALVPAVYHPSTPLERLNADFAIRLSSFPTAQGYWGQLQAIQMWSSFDRLDQLKTKTLVLHGDSDLLVPTKNGHLLAAALPNARLEILRDASHVFFTDQPEKTVSSVLKFFGE